MGVHAYGFIWEKLPGWQKVWTTRAELNGLHLTGYAIEHDDDPIEDNRSMLLHHLQEAAEGDWVEPIPFGDGEATIYWTSAVDHSA
jgi:hypothetical protein